MMSSEKHLAEIIKNAWNEIVSDRETLMQFIRFIALIINLVLMIVAVIIADSYPLTFSILCGCIVLLAIIVVILSLKVRDKGNVFLHSCLGLVWLIILIKCFW